MTLKEYLRQSNPRLDALADRAEVDRQTDEEFIYEDRVDEEEGQP